MESSGVISLKSLAPADAEVANSEGCFGTAEALADFVSTVDPKSSEEEDCDVIEPPPCFLFTVEATRGGLCGCAVAGIRGQYKETAWTAGWPSKKAETPTDTAVAP